MCLTTLWQFESYRPKFGLTFCDRNSKLTALISNSKIATYIDSYVPCHQISGNIIIMVKVQTLLSITQGDIT